MTQRDEAATQERGLQAAAAPYCHQTFRFPCDVLLVPRLQRERRAPLILKGEG